MTTRLTNLSNETNQKDQDLFRLQQEISFLRERQPYDFSSNGGMRWKSDDNVLSTSNSCSNGFHPNFNVINQQKQTPPKGSKKNTWLRSSFNRAFRRRRSTQSTSNLCDSSSDLASLASNGYNSTDEAQDPGAMKCPVDSNLYSNQRSVSVSALDATAVEELQQELLAKDDLLTETRLEALSSASQLQMLRESVAKLRHELKSVKSENEDLRHQLISLAPPHSRNRNRPRTSLILNSSPALVPPGQGQEVQVLLGDTPIGRLILPHSQSAELFRLNLHDLDESLRRLYGMFMARLDPNCLLSLMECNQSLGSYSYMEWSRSFLPTDDWGEMDRVEKPLSWDESNSLGSALVRARGKQPPHQLQRERLAVVEIRIAFKHNTVNQLAFTALRPLEELDKWVQTLLEERLVLISGPRSSGKTHLAAQLLVTGLGMCMGTASDVRSIDCAETQLEQKGEDILAEILASQGGRAFLLENVDTTLAQQLLGDKESIMKRNILLVATTEKPEQLFPPEMAKLTPPPAFVSHLLAFILRKRLLAQEVRSGTLAHPELMSAVTWLALICKTLHQRSSWVPKLHIFLECPLENPRKFRAWFVQTWNTIWVHELRRLDQIQFQNSEDPVKFVTRTWPWKDEAGGLKRDLQRVFAGRGRPRRNSTNTTEERLKPDGAEDPLMNMLICLQQATLDSNGRVPNS